MDRTTCRTLPRLSLASVGGLMIAGAIILTSTPASAGEKETKLERQIGVVVRTIDDMLVDSPNFLVAGKEVTEGFEVDDYGVIFTFKSSLTGPFWEENASGSFLGLWPMGKKRQIIMRKDDSKGEKEIILGDGKIIIRDGEVLIEDGGKTKKLSEDGDWVKIDEKTYREKQAQKYAAAKEELIKTLMEYGEVLKALPSGQSVRVIARFEDVEFPEGRDVNRLSLKASIDDLRAFGDGRLSESAMRAKIEIKES